MPVMLFLFIKLVAEAIRSVVNKTRAAKPQTLCATCSYAHVQLGANGRLVTSCTYSGGVRPVMLDVLYCTDYRDRNVQSRPVRIGFVPETKGSAAEG
jgi:hypothetical protein